MRRTTAILGVALIALLMALSPNGLSHWATPASEPATLRADSAQPAAVIGQVWIHPNGTVTPGSAPITQTGNTYTFTSGIAGSILDERNGSTIDGGGFALNTTPGAFSGFVINDATGVTVERLTIVNQSAEGFVVDSARQITLTSDTVIGSGFGVFSKSVAGLNISNNQFSGTEGIYVNYGSVLLISSNTLTRTSAGIYVGDFSSVTIRNNNVSYVTGSGIDVEYSANVLVTLNALYNLVTYARDQVFLYEDSGVMVSWNNGSAGDYAVYGEYLTSVTVAHNHFVGILSSGVYFDYATSLSVYGNDLPKPRSYVFYGYYVTGLTFTQNQGDHSGSDGVYIEYVTNALIAQNNLSFFTSDGVYAEYSSNVTIAQDQLSYSASTSGYGIYTYYDSALNLSADNATYDDYGWYDDQSQGIVSIGNNFSHTFSNGYAIYLEYDGGITIGNTQASNTYVGLYAYYTNGMTVRDSRFARAANEALYLYQCTGIILTNLDLNDSAGYSLEAQYPSHLVATNIWAMLSKSYAFYFYEGQDVVITGGNAVRSGYGLYGEYNSGLTVASTNLSQDQVGMYLNYNDAVTISDDSFWLDNVSFDYESPNDGVVYHNNFVGDNGWILNSNPTGSFSWANGYPVGGNFWSNYTGIDVLSGPGQNLPGSDRIGDTPFLLNGFTQDPYPLTRAWTAHTITFTESGLPAGVQWSASVDGTSSLTSSNALVFVEADGATAAFSYAIAPVPGFHVSPASGVGTESGSNVVISLVFTPVTYAITFSAAGLSGTTRWSVEINGETTTGTGPSLSVDEPNGTYTYVVVKGSPYSITPSPGTFTVVGGPVTVALTAREILYNLTFTESGLGSGTSWSVTVNGVTKSSTGSTIVFQEPNGTYSYTVGSVGGYTVSPAQGSANVYGGATGFAAAFTSTGLTGTSLVLLVGLILILLVAIAGWAMYLRSRKPGPPGPMVPAHLSSPPPGVSPPWAEGGGSSAPPPNPPTPPAP